MSAARCQICDAPMPGHWADYPDYPFCSRRCRTIDLGRWLGEEYRAPSPPGENRSTPGDDGSDPPPGR